MKKLFAELNELSKTLYAVCVHAQANRERIKLEEANQIRENIVFVLKMIQDGVKSPDYRFLGAMFRQQTLRILLNPHYKGYEEPVA